MYSFEWRAAPSLAKASGILYNPLDPAIVEQIGLIPCVTEHPGIATDAALAACIFIVHHTPAELIVPITLFGGRNPLFGEMRGESAFR